MNISEVSKKLNISSKTLRYYEQEKLIPAVRRNQNGYRDYTEYDINWIYFVKQMRRAGVSIKAISKYTALFLKDRDGTIDQRKQILLEQQQKMQEKIRKIQEALNFLNHKIDIYDDKFKFAEDKLDPYIQQHLDNRKDDEF